MLMEHMRQSTLDRVKRPVYIDSEEAFPPLLCQILHLDLPRDPRVAHQEFDLTQLLPDEDRLPAFGRKLRSTSLDEMPELFNMIKGDMSVVGPRPLLVQYLPRYNKHQARRHEVRPGFTGLAQVNGRNDLTWEEKFDWDVRYVDRITFLGDVKIILKTVQTVVKKEGISSDHSATMEEFMGEERA